MLNSLVGKEVTVAFLDGTLATGGVLAEADERYVKYQTEYQELYIPITSIRDVTLDTKPRERNRVGFGQ
ncbi:hypothetical protein [Paenibacillus donghaensis]|uniref:DUF2642 domain-containing protein n=1 Tax=Paenibacillus donghaensis TaxID=414771 RepID=A0A2Z2KBW5_9BACL|nr:hypothetical protein [Paenibacillus donghaensis]ASA20490.1 hypothetical protein B9T62_06540 [Paenibacillus donghaensis]